MLRIVGIKNCNTMKKTFDWLNEKGVDYDFRDVKKDPLDRDELESLAGRLGLDTLINKRGMKWRTLGLKDQDLSDAELMKVLEEHQTMIKRPVLVVDDAVMVGFDEEAVTTFLEEYL